ncbi:MAG: aldehyde dehydrogenase family protein [Rhodospirillaceae bacterium]|nr:aldehyde dehydrogenase family protein [Rhodospirillaceae bacterium]
MTASSENWAVTDVPMRIGDQWRESQTYDSIIDPYRHTVVSRSPQSTSIDLNDALEAAQTGAATMAAMPGYERAALIRRALSMLIARKEQIAICMTRETGKALKDSRAEVDRTADTLSLSAEEAIRIEGEHVPLDGTAMGAGKIAMMLRFPVGVIAAITPFNAPLNLAAHKIAPALAAGNSIVIKAPPQAAATVHKLIEVFVDAGVPAGALNSLYGQDVGPQLVRDPRVNFITFTGSTRVGAEIKAASGLKRVALELGGAGPAIVHDDADIPEAAALCARNAMRLAGQSCISVQNVYVHTRVIESFREKLISAVKALKVGDPLDPDTDVGTLIDEAAAKRVKSWADEAVKSGAQLLTGGELNGAQLRPIVLQNAPTKSKVVCEEVFGPLLNILPYTDIDAVFSTINAGRFGLQCGILTKSMPLAIKAARTIRAGGVIINGTSTWRTDQLPYGGVKDSGIGREGPRYAIRDMTEERLVVFNL